MQLCSRIPYTLNKGHLGNQETLVIPNMYSYIQGHLTDQGTYFVLVCKRAKGVHIGGSATA